MNDTEARQFLVDYFATTAVKVSKVTAEKLHTRMLEYEARRIDTLAERKLADDPVPPPARGPTPDQIRAYITEVLDPQLGISPPQM